MCRLILSMTLMLLLFGSAVPQLSQQNPTSQTTPVPQSPERAESLRLSEQVNELYRQGKYDEALPLAKRVVEIEEAAAPEQPNVAIALSNLAELYFQKERDNESEKLFRRASLIFQKHGLKTAAASNALERLAQLAFKRRKYEDAVSLLEQSLSIRELSFGKDSMPVSETLHEIANVHQANRQSDKAEPFYLRSIKIKEQVLGRANENTVKAMKDYACLSIRNRPLQPFKEEEDRALSEVEVEERSIRTRASCWLYGFDNNCETKAYKRPQQKPLAILNGRAVKLVQPPYPAAARTKRLSGRVYVAVSIDETGDVVAAKPVCGGHAELNGAGVEAARASKFTATAVSGNPVKVTGLIIYNFVAY